jgi:pseudouridine synthase
MRLNKAIASTGWCSRRQADELIEAGRVKVNGRVTRDFSFLVDPFKDRLSVEGRTVQHKKKEYVILYKPVGVLTTCDDERGRRTVLDILPETMQHLKPVGRLDRDSEGLLILTNDGDFAQRVTHPSQHVWKTYVAVVEGKISQHNLAKLRGGIELYDGMTAPARVTDVSINPDESSFRISIREGKNRQIRRMCTEIGHPVIRLVRVAIGRLQLRSMEPFDWRYLSKVEVEKCCED